MTTDELKAIRERAGKAAGGPWEFEEQSLYASDYNQFAITTEGRQRAVFFHSAMWKPKLADLEFITHARTDIPDLLAEVERLQGEVARANRVLEDALDKIIKHEDTITRLTDEIQKRDEALKELADKEGR